MSPGPRPIFHDPSGRRRRWTLRIAVGSGAVFLAIAIVFLLSLIAVPVLPPTLGLSVPMRRALRPHLPEPMKREKRVSRFLAQQERRRLLESIVREQREASAHAAPLSPPRSWQFTAKPSSSAACFQSW